LCAVLIDGTPFKDRQMIAALGIGCDGRKTVLGIREGATENTAVVSSLLSELVERGLDFSLPRLYILDGGKALHAAVRRHAGEAAFIQRCQVHKKRNVVDHLPDEHKADVNYSNTRTAVESARRARSRVDVSMSLPFNGSQVLTRLPRLGESRRSGTRGSLDDGTCR
jgi:transposase-like protein